MTPLTGSTSSELTAILRNLGQPEYRGRQIRLMDLQATADIESMTDIPRSLRDRLSGVLFNKPAGDRSSGCCRRRHGKVSSAKRGSLTVESVYLPYSDRVLGTFQARLDARQDVHFVQLPQRWASSRNLSAGEIVGQYLRMQHDGERRISHVVFMGMGEPLWNYDAVIKSIRILGDEVRHILPTHNGIYGGCCTRHPRHGCRGLADNACTFAPCSGR